MYSFHITGYEGIYFEDSQRRDTRVDILVYATTLKEALEKASMVLGHPVSTSERNIVIKECILER